MKKEKELQKKTVHSLWDNFRYMIDHWWKWNKRSMIWVLLTIPASVALPAITALVPKLLIDYITEHAPVSEMILMVCLVSFLVALLTWISPFLSNLIEADTMEIKMRYRMLVFDKLLYTDYGNIENEENRLKFERGKDFVFAGANNGPCTYFFFCITQLLTGIVGICSFLGLLSALKMWTLVIILATCIFDYLLSLKLTQEDYAATDKLAPFYQRLNYFYRLANNIPAGKDVRIYGAGDWFIRSMAECLAAYVRLLGKVGHTAIYVSAGRALMSLARDLVAYVYLIYCVLNGAISVSDFIFYFGIINGFSSWVLNVSYTVNDLRRICVECDRFREFIEIPERRGIQQNSVPIPTANAFPCEVEFRHVTFQYPGAQVPTIKDMSFYVGKGEKIAIVGENGAGKTTVIKLLCGFYRPTSGQILINGINTAEFDPDRYFDLFSAVFQDYNFLPLSITENIAVCPKEKADPQKVEHALRIAGIYDRIMRLPKGTDTLMNKQLNDDAVDFSGGEQQKLLLARAMYKDAPILILDEPTAALDPIAENEMYLKYHELAQEKTSFFISHRLSSTRFCDRILLIADGKIAEEGTHRELMEKNEKYRHMFDIQSYYYRLGANTNA